MQKCACNEIMYYTLISLEYSCRKDLMLVVLTPQCCDEILEINNRNAHHYVI